MSSRRAPGGGASRCSSSRRSRAPCWRPAPRCLSPPRRSRSSRSIAAPSRRPASRPTTGRRRVTSSRTSWSRTRATRSTTPPRGCSSPPPARNRWTDTTATIIQDERVVETLPPRKHRHRREGPHRRHARRRRHLHAEPAGHRQRRRAGRRSVYGIKRVNKQYRISNPSKGLLLTDAQFQQSYHAALAVLLRPAATATSSRTQRWSALEGAALEEWLVGELAAGPAPCLQNAVTSDTIPAQANTGHFSVTAVRTRRTIDIPGSGQLERGGPRPARRAGRHDAQRRRAGRDVHDHRRRPAGDDPRDRAASCSRRRTFGRARRPGLPPPTSTTSAAAASSTTTARAQRAPRRTTAPTSSPRSR